MQIRFLVVLWASLLTSSLFAEQFYSYEDSRISYGVRYTTANNSKGNRLQLGYAGCTIRIQFLGSRLRVKMAEFSGKQSWYHIIVDNDRENPLLFSPAGAEEHLLVDGLPRAQHSVEIIRLFGSKQAITQFYGVLLDDGDELIQTPMPPNRRIEFYGNSVTEGGAIEDQPYTQMEYDDNNWYSYARLTASALNAQYSCIAKSGIGLTKGYQNFLMPQMWDKTLAWDKSTPWDFSQWTPHIVVVNLLQNDWAQNADTATVAAGYLDFIQKIRSVYSDAHIICALGPMSVMQPNCPYAAIVQSIVESLSDPRIHTLFFPYKQTSGHPLIAEHQTMADTLIAFINTLENPWNEATTTTPFNHVRQLQPQPIVQTNTYNLLGQTLGTTPRAFIPFIVGADTQKSMHDSRKNRFIYPHKKTN